MDITVYGSGYVGLIVAACFAQTGNRVICMDVNKDKIAQLEQGQIPIYEPGLAQVIQDTNQNIRFTCDPKVAAEHGEVQFIAVGTPGDEHGKVDLRYVESVAKSIAKYIKNYTIIVNKSTVPIGAATKVTNWIKQGLKERNESIEFEVVSNPEFLREGCALEDFRNPDRIIVGANSQRARDAMQSLYAPFDNHQNKLMFMGVRSAELSKYAANAFLATKISFINQMANLAEEVDADIEEVRLGLGRDKRIGPDFLQAGCGYGGSCFAKDCQALLQIANDKNVNLDIVAATESSNQAQKLRLLEKIKDRFVGKLSDKVFAVWGLSFKPGTDDMRDAPSIPLLNALHELGVKTQVFDPQAMKKSKSFFNSEKCIYSNDKYQSLEGADALIILTEWPEFKQPDFAKIKDSLSSNCIFDGRNIFNPTKMAKLGFEYFAIGRSLQKPNIF
jgi:UDPglucose 6-dehydrogenase